MKGEITLTIDEVATLLGKTVGTVRKDMQRNPERVPPAFRVGSSKRPLFLKRVVVKFIEAHAQKHGAHDYGASEEGFAE